MLANSDTLSCGRFRPNDSLLILLNAVCLVEKQQIPFYSLWFDPPGVREPMTYRNRGKHTNHYTIVEVRE